MKERLSKSVMNIDKDSKRASVCCYHGKEVSKRQDKMARRHGYDLSHGMCEPHFKEEVGKIGLISRGVISVLFGKKNEK
jgi:hypothetical protein